MSCAVYVSIAEIVMQFIENDINAKLENIFVLVNVNNVWSTYTK